MNRTFSREDFERSLREWEAGKFSDEWKPWRHKAAMRGIIFPPEGSRYDSWEDDPPSQRAVLIRAIRETPKLLEAAINRSKSWYEVMEYVIRNINGWREELDQRERETRHKDEPTPRESVTAIGSIFDRIAESLGYVRRGDS